MRDGESPRDHSHSPPSHRARRDAAGSEAARSLSGTITMGGPSTAVYVPLPPPLSPPPIPILFPLPSHAEEKSPPFCATAGTTVVRFNSAQQATCFRAPARNLFLGSFSAKPGVLRKQNPGFPFFAQPARRLGAFRSDFSVLDAKTGGFLMARARFFFAVQQGIPVISALHAPMTFPLAWRALS